MNLEQLKTDCRYFNGEIPCKPHKEKGVHCVEADGTECQYYEQVDVKILIIKLGAIGDVIRTTPLFTKLKEEYHNAKVYWLTYSPAVVPAEVDVVLKPGALNLELLTETTFDIVINLDKDKEACALLHKIEAKTKHGFTLKDGLPYPVDEKAHHKYLTGIFDDLNQANTKNYLEEIFEICGFDYNGEKYILDSFEKEGRDWELDKSKKIIGFNTGCGGRWTSRLWSEKYWVELAENLIAQNYEVVFLGGEQEDEQNRRMAKAGGAKYIGHFPLKTFINLVDQCDLVVTAVTMAMHITLALNKKILLFNNIFNRNEFELFGLGEIVEPSKECTCFFRPKCINPDYKCMDYIEPERVLKTINRLLS